MGKHSQGRPPGPGGGRGSLGGQRRVPAERRRTPGERSTSARVHGDEGYMLSDPSSRRRGSLESAPARLRVERDKRRSRGKRIALIVAACVLALLLVVAGGLFAFAMHVQGTMQGGTQFVKSPLTLALTPTKPMQPYNVLLLGVDQRPGETQYRSDSMIVAHIDPVTKHVWLVSIPRDTRVMIPGHGEDKINAAHFFGGPELTVKTVSQFTGLKINHYLEVNFTGFKRAVDKMGGVWVNVPVAINDIDADRSPHHRAAKIPAGYQRLDGEHALTFVRARHQFADQDFSRMKNQQIFFKAIAEQMAKTSTITKIPMVISAVAPYVRTDMDLIDMMKTAQALRQMGGKNVFSATVTGEWRSPYIYPDEAVLAKIISAVKDERPFDGTRTVAATATAVVDNGGNPLALRKPAQVSVTVNNGAGIVGAAKQAATILKAQGFKVPTTGNANQNVYKQTLVIYKTDQGLARLVASYLPPGTKVVQSRGMYAFKTDVLVVVGRDWDVTKVPAAPIKTQ